MAIGSRQQQTGQGPRQQPGQMGQKTRAATQEYQPPQGQGTKSQDQRGVQGQRLAATGQDRYGPSTHSQERGVQGRLAAMGQGTGRGNPRSGAGAQAFKRHGGMGQTNMLAQASPWMNQGASGPQMYPRTNQGQSRMPQYGGQQMGQMNQGQSQMPQYGGQQMGQQQNQIRESLGGIATGLAGRVGAFGQGNPNQQAQMLNQQAIDANGEDAVNDYYQKLMSSPGYQGGPPPAQQMAQTQEATFRGQMNQMQDQMPQYGGQQMGQTANLITGQGMGQGQRQDQMPQYGGQQMGQMANLMTGQGMGQGQRQDQMPQYGGNQMGQMANLMTGQGMGQVQGPLMGGSNLMTGQGMGQGQRQQMGQMANRMAGQGMGQGMGQGQRQQMGQMANRMAGQGMGQGMGQGQMQQMGQMANLMTGMRKQ